MTDTAKGPYNAKGMDNCNNSYQEGEPGQVESSIRIGPLYDAGFSAGVESQRAEVERLGGMVAALREALNDSLCHPDHEDECRWRGGNGPCTCGFKDKVRLWVRLVCESNDDASAHDARVRAGELREAASRIGDPIGELNEMDSKVFDTAIPKVARWLLAEAAALLASTENAKEGKE